MKPATLYLCLTLLVTSTLSDSHLGSSPRSSFHSKPEWTGWGGSIYNNRWVATNPHISAAAIKNVNIHCQVPHAPGGVSAGPTIFNELALYPTWSGLYIALDYTTCQIKWQINVTAVITNFKEPTPFQRAMLGATYTEQMLCSRSSAQIDKRTNVLYFTTLLHALVVAADISNGSVLGVAQINSHPAASATLSPTLYEGILYAGSSSQEELLAGVLAGYKCCSFVGNAVALKFNPNEGRFTTIWNLSMLPANRTNKSNSNNDTSWSGIGVWGSQPAIDPGRRLVFYGTGNVYSIPQAFSHCAADKFSPTTSQNTSCLPDWVWQNSILALDLQTGNLAWIKRFGPLDVWVFACGLGVGPVLDPSNCPGSHGPDYDFGMAPTFVPGQGKRKDVLTVGQKSGYLYSLAADTGEVQWATATSPGAVVGGLSWGIATDDRQVYFTGINSLGSPWVLQPENRTTVNNSLFGAASLADGKLRWEIQVEDNGRAYTPPTVVGDIVLVGRVSQPGVLPITGDGTLVALGKEDGRVIFELPLNGTLRGGIAVQDRYVLFGTGYTGSDGVLYVLKV